MCWFNIRSLFPSTAVYASKNIRVQEQAALIILGILFLIPPLKSPSTTYYKDRRLETRNILIHALIILYYEGLYMDSMISFAEQFLF